MLYDDSPGTSLSSSSSSPISLPFRLRCTRQHVHNLYACMRLWKRGICPLQIDPTMKLHNSTCWDYFYQLSIHVRISANINGYTNGQETVYTPLCPSSCSTYICMYLSAQCCRCVCVQVLSDWCVYVSNCSWKYASVYLNLQGQVSFVCVYVLSELCIVCSQLTAPSCVYACD